MTLLRFSVKNSLRWQRTACCGSFHSSRPLLLASSSLYDELGVPRSATPSEIKVTYFKLAIKVHPDINDSPDAAAEFRRLGRAYSHLSDPCQRKLYDENEEATQIRRARVSGSAPSPETERYWQKPSYNSLQRSIEKMAKHCKDTKVKLLCMPRIGCGLDGLQWSRVQDILINCFEKVPTKLIVYYL